MIEQLWDVAQGFLASPDSNRIAQAFFGILMLVLAWSYTPIILATIPALQRGGVIRGILALAIIAIMTLTMALSVGSLAFGR